ncbi:MAG: hypothetical protein HAW67_06700 [Endozoicomonadaceae bacterium]|nr:hypothetical protein [Endozoicomonadaceae bacterium]
MQNKKLIVAALSLVITGTFSTSSIAYDSSDVKKDQVAIKGVPVTFESYFKQKMNEPLVMLYEGQKAYESGNYDKALSWYLKGSKYLLEPAVENARFMITNNQGAFTNRDQVIEFLTYYGTDHGETIGDIYSQMYLGDFYSGASCVWEEYRVNMYPASCGNKELSSDKDKTQAYYWYSQAAIQGQVRALYSMGMMDILGIGASRNISKGLKSLERVAETGHPNAAYLVGMIYKTGFWIDQDNFIAVKWLERSAEKNNIDAMIELADNYRRSVGVTIDSDESVKKAVKWYQKIIDSVMASNKRKAQAHYEKGLMFLSFDEVADPVKGIEHLEEAIEVSEDDHNRFEILSLMKLADLVEGDSHEKALGYLKQAELILRAKSNVQRKPYAYLYQMMANIYADGTSDIEPDERMFAKYMTKYHSIRATTDMVLPKNNELFGYEAFKF